MHTFELQIFPISRIQGVAMNRRTLLAGLSGLLALVCAAVLAIPGVRYLLGALSTGGANEDVPSRRIVPLASLVPGVPTMAPVTGKIRDAWTVYNEQTIGRLWIVRTDDNQDPQQAELVILSAECPHMGCTIGTRAIEADGENRPPFEFYCGCHRAQFDAEGALKSLEGGGENPAPRGMDRFDKAAGEWAVVQDEKSKEWWVEVRFKRFETGTEEKKPIG